MWLNIWQCGNDYQCDDRQASNKQERFFALKISSIMATRLFGLFMIFPVFSVYAVQYENTTPYLIGLAIGIYGLTQALLQIPFGYLSDQFGRKPLLVVGLVFFFIGSVVAANSTDIIHVVIGRALQGSSQDNDWQHTNKR
jgi:MFS family permease